MFNSGSHGYFVLHVNHNVLLVHPCLLQQEGKYNHYAIMEVLSCLCDQGGDPTIICGQERTPKVIAEEDKCYIAAALLGMCLNTDIVCIV